MKNRSLFSLFRSGLWRLGSPKLQYQHLVKVFEEGRNKRQHMGERKGSKLIFLPLP
jgi:hypothetical protein